MGFFKEYRIPYIDDASIENSLNCLAVALYLMVPTETIAARMAKLEPVAMRLEVKDGKNGCVLINDSYNSDFASLDIALDFKACRRTLILSDILETGQSGKQLYSQVAELVHSRGVNRLIGVGEGISAAAARFDLKEKQFFRTTEELMVSGVLETLRGDIVLIKGARPFRFDEISSFPF